jgi:hypothetical protein
MMHRIFCAVAIIGVHFLVVDGSSMLRRVAEQSRRLKITNINTNLVTVADPVVGKDTSSLRTTYLGRFLCGPIKIGCIDDNNSSNSSTGSGSSSASTTSSSTSSGSTSSGASTTTSGSGNTKSGHDDTLDSNHSGIAWMAALGAAVGIAALVAAKKVSSSSGCIRAFLFVLYMDLFLCMTTYYLHTIVP